MENTKENNIIDFQTEKERRQESREEEKTSFEYCMQWGDVWKLPETEQFQEASPVVQYDMMGRALDKRIELNNKTFLDVLRTDPKGAGIFLENAIKPLRIMREALVTENAREQINQNPFSEDAFEDQKAA